MEEKQRSSTLKRKKISFLNDAKSLFCFPTASFAIEQGVFVPFDRSSEKRRMDVSPQ